MPAELVEKVVEAVKQELAVGPHPRVKVTGPCVQAFQRPAGSSKTLVAVPDVSERV
jgi:hypothetical protein